MTMQNLRQAGGDSLGDYEGAWGADGDFRGRNLLDSRRYAILTRKLAYFENTQHKHKSFDMDGRTIADVDNVWGASQPLIGERFGAFVPLAMRRPSAPYRLCPAIVRAFTALVFGEDRWPEILCAGDKRTADYADALSKAQELQSRFGEARNIGGACGSVGISWAFVDGSPVSEVHKPHEIWIRSWADRSKCIPRHVVKCFQYPREVWDPKRERFETKWFWFRRDWTPVLDVEFFPVEVRPGKLPTFVPDPNKVVQHKDGITHFTWVQNIPCEDVDGISDTEGLLEAFDALDMLLSATFRGLTLNLDPTLVLNMDAAELNMMGVQKGSGNAIVPGENGDAKYLELAGTSIAAGISMFNTKRKTTLETAECVFPDPDEITAAGTSSVALKMLFAPMLGKASTLRTQWDPALRRHLEPQIAVARSRSRSRVVVIDELTGAPKEIVQSLNLPPRIEELPPDQDNPDGRVVKHERDPGSGEQLELKWGPWFAPTPQDLSANVTALTTATGGKAVVSQQTATEMLATALDRDPDEEWGRMQGEHQQQASAQSAMFGGMPGGVPGSQGNEGSSTTQTINVPGGGTIKHVHKAPKTPSASSSSSSASEEPSGPSVPIGPGDWKSFTTVDEARASMGLPPIGGNSGAMTVAAFQAINAVPIAKAANADLGKVGVMSANPPKPAGPPGAPGSPPGAPKPPGGPPVAAKPPAPVSAPPRPGPGKPPGF